VVSQIKSGKSPPKQPLKSVKKQPKTTLKTARNLSIDGCKMALNEIPINELNHYISIAYGGV